MKKRVRRIVLSLIPLIILFSFSIVALDFYLPISSSKGSPITTKYHMDEDGLFLANIPFEDYLHDATEIEGTVYDIRDYGASKDKSF